MENYKKAILEILEIALNAPELNMGNYNEHDVELLNNAMIEVYQIAFSVREANKASASDGKEHETLAGVSVRLPSHAELTKEALNVYGDDESEQVIQRHRDYIAGGVWMLDECNKKVNER